MMRPGSSGSRHNMSDFWNPVGSNISRQLAGMLAAWAEAGISQATPHSLSGCHPSFRAATSYPLPRAAAITHMLAHALVRQHRTHGCPWAPMSAHTIA